MEVTQRQIIEILPIIAYGDIVISINEILTGFQHLETEVL